MKCLYILSFCFLFFTSQAQEDYKGDLVFYGDVMINASKSQNREKAGTLFRTAFDNYISSHNLFEKDLSFLEGVSVLQPEDNAFKLLSWQLELDDNKFEYYCYLVKPDGSFIEFKQNDYPREVMEAMEMSPEEWYGCIYYNIMSNGPGKYLLFGFNGNGKWKNLKLADIMTIEGEEILLGYPGFEDKLNPGTRINRLVLSYSSDATLQLNYNPGLQLIIHDHLIQRIGRIPGQGPVFLPDGTYEGYEFIEGIWMYREKIYDHTYDAAPRPKPVLGNKKDLFGKG
ncbi:MAG: hypothetical protein KJO50_02760 [Bacteroidia bacterium]|nr:hypothetical protein [Bacteroidia bacterium]